MRKVKVWDILSLLLIIANFIIGLIFAPNLPNRVPTHWNFYGQIDGYGSKDFLIWQMPLAILGLYLLLHFIPSIDPKKRNYKEFTGIYSIIKLIVTVFLSSLLWISIAASFGIYIEMNVVIPTLVGILFIAIGALATKVKQNYFVGFRTPWAIENEEVWDKTQKVGGRSFMIGGMIVIILSYFKLLYFLIAVFAVIVMYPFLYSYLTYRKIKKEMKD